MNSKKFLFMLGLSRKAGKITVGTDLVTKLLPSGKIKLVVYASDASLNTKKRITDKTRYYGVPCYGIETDSLTLSHAIGKSGSVCVVGVSDESFSKELTALITDETR